NAEAPWRSRTAPSSASSTPHQQIANRHRSTCSDRRESSKVPITAATPEKSLSTRPNLSRKTRTPGPERGDPALTPCRANRLLLLIGRLGRGVPRRVVRVVRVRRLGLHGVGARAVAGRGALLVHRLLARLAHHFDLLGPIGGRIEAGAH